MSSRRSVGAAAMPIVVCVTVAVAALWGMSAGGRPADAHRASRPLASVDHVVIVSVPGLRWQDLAALDTPHLDAYLDASALLSVRSIGPTTSRLEGYLALNAGNRLEIAEGGPPRVVAAGHGACLPDVAIAARAAADDDLNGARPGALGDALAAAGVRASVFGDATAIAGLMDARGCVPLTGDTDEAPADLSTAARSVTLVEFAGLDATDVAADRATTIAALDRWLGHLAMPDQSVVIIAAPSAVDGRAETTVVGVGSSLAAPPDARRGSLVSPFTRRAGYVTVTDLGPTVLAVLGVAVPEAMSGTPIAVVDSTHDGIETQVAAFADVASRVTFRDRAVGPVSVVLVAVTMLCGTCWASRRGRTARMLAPWIVAYVLLSFLSGLTPYHRLPLGAYLMLLIAGAAMVAACAVGAMSRLARWAPTALLAGAVWGVMVVDVMTGGRLQINTPLGYSPTIAGRFQGFGNLAFGLVAASAIVSAVVVALAERGVVSSPRALWYAAWVAGITTVAIAAPGFGSDVGGTLAIVPAWSITLLLLSGRRVSWRRAVAVLAAGVAAVGLLALVDLQRPPASRTHLGRFLDDVLHGDGGLLIRRKLRGNLAILTSSVWSFVLVVLIVGLLAWGWRRREAIGGVLHEHHGVLPALAGAATAGFLGFALNDSGLAVPAIMGAVLVPWLVAVLVPVTDRHAM